MTAALSFVRRPISPSVALRPSNLLALLQPSFWACSWSQFSACKPPICKQHNYNNIYTFIINIVQHFCSHFFINTWVVVGEKLEYLDNVIVTLFKCFLAVDESVASGFTQFHQQRFICCQQSTACMQMFLTTDLRKQTRKIINKYIILLLFWFKK